MAGPNPSVTEDAPLLGSSAFSKYRQKRFLLFASVVFVALALVFFFIIVNVAVSNNKQQPIVNEKTTTVLDSPYVKQDEWKTQPFSTVDPVGGLGFAKVTRTGFAAPSNLWAVDGARPTNSWWTNIVLSEGTDRSNDINVEPFILRSGNGLIVSMPFTNPGSDRVFQAEWIDDYDMNLGSSEKVGVHKAVGYDHLSVALQWDSNSGSMVAPVVRGMAYVTMEYYGLTPAVWTREEVVSLTADGQSVDLSTCDKSTAFKAERLQMQLRGSDSTWVVYFSKPLKLVCDSSAGQFQVMAKKKWDGVVRVAQGNNCTTGHSSHHCHEGQKRDQSEYMALLDKHSKVYPVGGALDFSFSGNTGKYFFKWQKKTFPAADDSTKLLFVTLQHHRDILKADIMPYGFRSVRGWYGLVAADTWELQEKLPTMGWGMKNITGHAKKEVMKALEQDKLFEMPIHFQLGVSDPYFNGKLLARYGQVIMVAESMDRMDIVQAMLPKLKQYASVWLNRQSGNRLVYDSTWGGIISCGCQADWDHNPTECFNSPPNCPTLGDAGYDFGNAYFNDHHFHYGYHLYTSAVITHFDKQWGNKYKDILIAMCRDIANPSTQDPFFPLFRYKDWYQGSSWASGIGLQGNRPYMNGRNQESGSESANAWYAMYLLGMELGNEYLSNMGRLLLSAEVRSIKAYYQVTSTDIYPEAFAQHKMIGMLWSNAALYQTWFNLNHWAVHGIQLMPVTPVSDLLFSPSFIKEEFPIFQQSCLSDAVCGGDGWYSLVAMVQAIIDPQGAWKWALDFPDSVFSAQNAGGNGNSRTSTLYWIAQKMQGQG